MKLFSIHLNIVTCRHKKYQNSNSPKKRESKLHFYVIIITNMLIVHYSMQFSGNNSNHVQHRSVQVNGRSTNTTKVHALLLPSKH